MFDIVVKIIALVAFVGSLAIVAVKVPSFDLVTVIVVVAAMAIYDLLIRPDRKRTGDGS